jgi:hypothetical protein
MAINSLPEASLATQPRMQLRIGKLTLRCYRILDRRRQWIGVHVVENSEVGARAEINATVGGDPRVLAIGDLQLGWRRDGRSAETGC